MSHIEAQDQESISYQALLDKNHILENEIESLRARLEEAEELKRAISEGDLDALVIPGPEGELIFTLDSADRAYRVLVETMNEGTATFGFDGTILYCNRRFAELLNMPSESIVGTSIYQFISTESTVNFNAFLKHKMNTGEINLKTKDGNSLPVLLSINSVQTEGSPNAWCLVVTDLTEQKKNKEILSQAQSSIEQVAEIITICDESGRIVRFSNAMSELCGCNPIFQRFEDLVDLRFSEGEDAGENILPVTAALKGSAILGMETNFESETLQTFHFLLNSGPLRGADGKIIGCTVTLTDITELKRAQEEIEKQARLLNLSHDAILLRDSIDRITYWNTGAQEVYGYTKREALGRISHELLKTEFPLPLEQIFEILYQDSRWIGELIHTRKDGRKITVVTRWVLDKDVNGNPTSILETNSDITEQKKAEAKLKETLDNLEDLVKERTMKLEKAYNSLKETKEDFAEAQEVAHLGNWKWNLVTNELRWSDEVYRIFGFKPQEFEATYDFFLNYVHPDNQGYVNDSAKVALSGKPFDIDFRIISADGKERIINAKCNIVFDENNIPVGTKGTVQDITDRKKVEKILQENESRFRNLFEVISSGVIIYDVINDGRDFIFKDINPAGERIDNVQKENIIEKSLYEFFPNVGEMGLDEALRRVWHTGRSEFFPLTIYKDERISLWVTNYIYKLPSGELVAVFEDITERKQAEETLAKIEIARKKEIHHRIKNNLQVISSLLDLQAEQFRGRKGIQDSEVLEAFRESQDRVISMALIHEELYKGGGFETLDFAPYIEELAENLFQTYSLRNTDINLKLDLVENAFFDMDTAIPLGMIINELVSNSFKHAFIGRDKGEIGIELCREVSTEFECTDGESSDFVLTVSDNGVGIPDNLDIEDLDSLGMQLVISLVDQLDGEFELKRENGTEFTLRFTVTENNSAKSVPPRN